MIGSPLSDAMKDSYRGLNNLYRVLGYIIL